MSGQAETAEVSSSITPAEQAKPPEVVADDTAAAPDPAPADDLVVSIGEESPPPKDEPTPKWVRDLRKTNREQARRIKELEARATAQPAPSKTAPTKKPTLSDADYDEAKFEAALRAWDEDQRKASDEAKRIKDAAEKVALEAQGRLGAYAKKKTDLKVSDFDDAEAVVLETLSEVQQSLILEASDDAALVVYAIGKRPEKAKELAGIQSHVKFVAAVAKLEKDLKVSSRESKPEPEKKVRGTAPLSGNGDTHLAKLRAEAERTGDMTKVIAYKNQQKRKKD